MKSAFPTSSPTLDPKDPNAAIYGEPGMTLRDWFAGMAMQGILAGSERMSWKENAIEAFNQANAMLKAR